MARAAGLTCRCSPVGAAEALALAGAQVGKVHGLNVGLAVGAQPVRRPRGTDPAAENGIQGSVLQPGHGLSSLLCSGLRDSTATVTWEATSGCLGSVTQLWSKTSGAGASSPVPGEQLGPGFRGELLIAFIVSLPLKSLTFWMGGFFLSETFAFLKRMPLWSPRNE